MQRNNRIEYVFFRDSIVGKDKAFVSLTSTLAQYGLNVFEGVRGYYNRDTNDLYIFRLHDHVDRLFRSAKMLRFCENPALTKEFVIDKVVELIRANNLKEDSYIKIGLFLDDEKGWSSTEPVSLFIFAYPKGRVFEDCDGLACCVSSWRRINDAAFPPRIKAAPNYINSRLAMLEAKMNGYDYTLILNNRLTVAEGPGACVFMVREGKLILPPVYSSILESITSDTVVDIARNILDIEVVEREIDRTELYIADEVFMAGTMIEIKPVTSVDGLRIGNNSIGKITERIISEYFNIVYYRNEAYSRWLTLAYNRGK